MQISKSCEEGTAAVVPWNWCGIIGSFTQRCPTAFSRNGRGLCLMTHTAVPFKGVSRRLLLVLSLTPSDKFNFLKDRLYVWKYGIPESPLTPFKSQVAHAEPKPGAPPTRGRQHHVTAVPWRCYVDGHGTVSLSVLILNHTRLQLVHCIPGFPIPPIPIPFFARNIYCQQKWFRCLYIFISCSNLNPLKRAASHAETCHDQPSRFGCGTLFQTSPFSNWNCLSPHPHPPSNTPTIREPNMNRFKTVQD